MQKIPSRCRPTAIYLTLCALWQTWIISNLVLSMQAVCTKNACDEWTRENDEIAFAKQVPWDLSDVAEYPWILENIHPSHKLLGYRRLAHMVQLQNVIARAQRVLRVCAYISGSIIYVGITEQRKLNTLMNAACTRPTKTRSPTGHCIATMIWNVDASLKFVW